MFPLEEIPVSSFFVLSGEVVLENYNKFSSVENGILKIFQRL